MPTPEIYQDLDFGVEAAPCVPVVVGHLADALELPWPSPEAVEALSLLEEPVVLRGGARSFLSSSSSSSPSAEETEGWCHRWSLDALARGNPRQRVLVRAAPSPSFPVPNGALLPLVVAALGPRAAPSLASLLPLREAAERMQAGCPLPPLAFSSQASPFSSLSSLFSSPSLYSSPSPRTAAAASVVSDGTAGGRQEWYYIQSHVPREWLGEGAGSEGGADSSPLSALLLPGGAASPPAPSRRTVTQDYRLWLSPPNAVSPLHWDVSRSALAVLRGAKTFHFWTPQDTFGALGPRSEWGLLRRRCAAEPAAAAAGAGRRRCPPAALRAVVRAGDAVAFPPFWAHHVLSHGEEGAEGAEGAGAGDGGGGGAGGGGGGGGGAGAEQRAPRGRPSVALTRRASSGVAGQAPPPPPPRRLVVPTTRLWKGLGAARL